MVRLEMLIQWLGRMIRRRWRLIMAVLGNDMAVSDEAGGPMCFIGRWRRVLRLFSRSL